MSEPRTPQLIIENGRAWLVCTTPRCGKRLCEIAPGTLVAAGWVGLQCRHCKTDYRLTPEDQEPLQAAS